MRRSNGSSQAESPVCGNLLKEGKCDVCGFGGKRWSVVHPHDEWMVGESAIKYG